MYRVTANQGFMAIFIRTSLNNHPVDTEYTQNVLTHQKSTQGSKLS